MNIWSLSKHKNLTTGKNIVEKRRNCSYSPLFNNIFNTSNFKSPIHIYLLNVVNQIIFSWTLQIWYVEVRISRSISESPLEFEITRVDCIWLYSFFKRHLLIYLYNFDPVKAHFYVVKLGFTGVYITFLISAQKHRLWVLVRTASARQF